MAEQFKKFKKFKKLSRMFSNMLFNKPDQGIEHFCRTEYGTDWFWAYSELKKRGKLPRQHIK